MCALSRPSLVLYIVPFNNIIASSWLYSATACAQRKQRMGHATQRWLSSEIHWTQIEIMRTSWPNLSGKSHVNVIGRAKKALPFLCRTVTFYGVPDKMAAAAAISCRAWLRSWEIISTPATLFKLICWPYSCFSSSALVPLLAPMNLCQLARFSIVLNIIAEFKEHVDAGCGKDY